MRKRVALLLVVLLLVTSSSIAFAAPERHETLVVGGGPWNPATNWNPLYPQRTSATIGLVYETLFSYNPETNVYKPWLAKSGEWSPTPFMKLNCAVRPVGQTVNLSQRLTSCLPTNWLATMNFLHPNLETAFRSKGTLTD